VNRWKKKIHRIVEIIGWGLIATALFILILKLAGIIHSPAEVTIETLLDAGILVLLGDMRAKLGILWEDFKKRKKL
jgi:hypothetical protein